MIEVNVLIPFLIASVSLTISPGPDIICVLMQSLSHGKKSGIFLSLGLVLGIVVHTTLIALGVATFISSYPLAFTLIKIVGSIYLFWIAFNIYKAPVEIFHETNSSEKSYFHLIKQGFFMNVLNPKVTLFFLAFFPGFINIDVPNYISQIYLLGFIFMIQAFLVFVGVSLISDRISILIRANSRFLFFIKWIQIIVFIAIGIFFLF